MIPIAVMLYNFAQGGPIAVNAAPTIILAIVYILVAVDRPGHLWS
jgi:hypothetical protein